MLSSQYLSIPFDNWSDDPKECKFFSFFFTEKLAIELNKLKEDAFEQCFSVLRTLFLIHQCYESIVYESCRDVIISKIDKFQQSPSIEHGKDVPFNSK